jgi:hypothetical protein
MKKLSHKAETGVKSSINGGQPRKLTGLMKAMGQTKKKERSY